MKGGPRIPAAPFVRWCQHQLRVIANRGAIGMLPTERVRATTVPPGPCAVLARRVGVDVRTLSRYLNGWDSAGRRTTMAPRHAVEDMLHRAGEDFYAVYPQYLHERDIDLEPDAWCPTCQEITTPHHGLCLWCARRVTDPTPQRHARAPVNRGDLRRLTCADTGDPAVRELAGELARILNDDWPYGELAA